MNWHSGFERGICFNSESCLRFNTAARFDSAMWFRTFHSHLKIPENQTPWKGTSQPETLDSLARELESASTFP